MSLLCGSISLAGDIWSTGAFSFDSPLKDLLDSKNYTLEQLLAEDELLQELRGLHPVLTEYFAREQSVTKLIRYITLPPSPPKNKDSAITAEGDYGESPTGGSNGAKVTELTAAQRLTRQLEKRKSGDKSDSPETDPEFKHIRFPYMACEIICCEIDGIIKTLVDGYTKEEGKGNDKNQQGATSIRLLDLLFNVLYDTPAGQLDDYRAGYFDKILSLLFRKKSQEMSIYMNTGGSRGQQSLMEAMMKHLYSHSIMQICQRLLLPPRPTPKQPETEVAVKADPNAEETEAGDDVGQDILAGEDDEGGNGVGIKCDWSKSGKAIEMLLQRLISPETLLQENAPISPVSSVETDMSIEEQRLSLSLNASEVLITVIQNSMLSSETMLSLTSFETMKRLTDAATVPKEGEFSPHESIMTSAMNVVESLILQLGGYGAVGTMTILEQAESQEQETARTLDSSGPLPLLGNPPDEGDTIPQVPTASSSGSEGEQSGVAATSRPVTTNLIADLTSLLQVLPEMLKGFSNLLRHPSTSAWKSPVQFSKDEPVQILGTSRLRIVRVLESLVLLGDPAVDSKLVESDCLRICLDLFWEFQWCSMLHQSVANLLVHVFEGQNARFEIQEYFLSKCNLIGRLMNSFIDTSNPGAKGLVMEFGGVVRAERTSSETRGDSAPADVLPVSEDDIDAALEKQEGEEYTESSNVVDNVDMLSTEVVNPESRDASTAGISIPAQSFRFGYMGHVIIICQALVQACANEWVAEQSVDMTSQPEGNTSLSGDVTTTTGGSRYEPLMIADLVNNHELSERWQDFVISTLASEISVQSTPLGGLNAQPTDPLQAHRPEGARRPGLADDGDIEYGNGAMAPPVPRGMISNLDENDLEAAASMMTTLNLGRPATDDASDGSGNSGDSNRSYNSGEINNSGGYLFDDPLGKGGSLGIELGKLTQYRPEDNGPEGGSDDDGNNSSSDEEPENRDSDNDEDPPVMDLFAGNFEHSEGSPVDNQPDPAAFDFADFGAFDSSGSDEVFGDFTSANPTTEALAIPEKKNDLDDLFVSPSKSGVLDEIVNSPEDNDPAPEGSDSALNSDPEMVIVQRIEPEVYRTEESPILEARFEDADNNQTASPTEAGPGDPDLKDKTSVSEELTSSNKGASDDSSPKDGVLVS